MPTLSALFSAFVYDTVTSDGITNLASGFFALLRCVYRVFILRPFIILSVMVMAVMTAVPVAVFISPSFTPEVLSAGLLRAVHLLPDAYMPLCVVGVFFELVYVLRHVGVLMVPFRRSVHAGNGSRRGCL